mmetsp:Transcript_19567/g.56826  ORF Transcript_19567/g.56826 Transcript_19567/m.56826 type:complete len:219 (-) Transcript_19567:63-719(-)
MPLGVTGPRSSVIFLPPRRSWLPLRCLGDRDSWRNSLRSMSISAASSSSAAQEQGDCTRRIAPSPFVRPGPRCRPPAPRPQPQALGDPSSGSSRGRLGDCGRTTAPSPRDRPMPLSEPPPQAWTRNSGGSPSSRGRSGALPPRAGELPGPSSTSCSRSSALSRFAAASSSRSRPSRWRASSCSASPRDRCRGPRWCCSNRWNSSCADGTPLRRGEAKP